MFVKHDEWPMLQHTFHLQRSDLHFLYYSESQQVVVFTGRYLQGKMGKLW